MQKFDSIIIRYGEIALKGKNRPFFERKLIRNIERKFKEDNIEYQTVFRISGRLIIKSSDKNAISALSKIFGIVSFSPAVETKSNLEDIKKKTLEIVKKEISKGSSVRISSQRTNKEFPLKSSEINSKVANYLLENTKDIEFDYKNYNKEILIEVSKENTYIAYEKHKSLGGLPVGVSGKVICLFSGGIDSPVAALKAMKRGCEIELIHFFNEANNPEIPNKIKDLYFILKEYQPWLRMRIVPFSPIERKIIIESPEKYRIIILRIMFLRFIDLFYRGKAETIFTGDNLAQVASQTLSNLKTISQFSKKLILRPLIGMDKQEIIDLAKKYKTYESSIKSYSDCCSFLVPRHPKTTSKYEDAKKISDKISDQELKELFEKIETYN